MEHGFLRQNTPFFSSHREKLFSWSVVLLPEYFSGGITDSKQLSKQPGKEHCDLEKEIVI